MPRRTCAKGIVQLLRVLQEVAILLQLRIRVGASLHQPLGQPQPLFGALDVSGLVGEAVSATSALQ